MSTRAPKCSGRKTTEQNFFMSNVLTQKSRNQGYQFFVYCIFFGLCSNRPQTGLTYPNCQVINIPSQLIVSKASKCSDKETTNCESRKVSCPKGLTLIHKGSQYGGYSSSEMPKCFGQGLSLVCKFSPYHQSGSIWAYGNTSMSTPKDFPSCLPTCTKNE